MPIARLCVASPMVAAALLISLPRAVPIGGAILAQISLAQTSLAQGSAVSVTNAWARSSAGAATTGAAYITLSGGPQADQLIGASTPIAATADVHQTLNENGVLKMRATPTLPIAAGQTMTFAPGGTHIMLTGLKQPLVAGQTFPLTLTFAHAAPVTVDVKVQPLVRGAPAGDHGPAHMH